MSKLTVFVALVIASALAAQEAPMLEKGPRQ